MDLDIDLDDDLFGDNPTQEIDAAVVAAANASVNKRPIPRLFIFEPGGNFIQQSLDNMGIISESVELGSDLMAAAEAQKVSVVLMSPGMDEELRELFVRAFTGRFAMVPVVYISDRYNDPALVAEFHRQGAKGVLPWPLPAASDLLPFLDAHAPSGTQIRAAAEQMASGEEPAEMALLRRKVANLEERTKSAVSAEQFEQAVQEAASKNAENTSLRSEMTILRERASLLEERLQRVQRDLENVAKERDELLQGASHPKAGVSVDDESAALLRGVESFVWPVEQAIQFLEDLAHEAGAQRAPSLDIHLRTIKLVKTLLERIRDRFSD